MFCTIYAAGTSDSRGGNSLHQAPQVSGSCTDVAQNHEGQLHAQLHQQRSRQLHLVLAALPVSARLQTRGFPACGCIPPVIVIGRTLKQLRFVPIALLQPPPADMQLLRLSSSCTLGSLPLNKPQPADAPRLSFMQHTQAAAPCTH